MLKRNGERGDTIIEVLFAITVFSLVAVGSLSLMNQGTGIAQRALEIGLVRQQIDIQTDALRYLNSAYIESIGKPNSPPAQVVWDKLVTQRKQTVVQEFNTVANPNGCRLPTDIGSSSIYKPFAIDVSQLKDALGTDPVKANTALSKLILIPTNSDTLTYAKVGPNADPNVSGAEAQGIWIEAYQAGSPGFYDFHITACWTSPGQEVPVTLGTIVRLYVPQ